MDYDGLGKVRTLWLNGGDGLCDSALTEMVHCDRNLERRLIQLLQLSLSTTC